MRLASRLDCKRLKWDTAESQLKLSIERLEALDRAIDPSRELWSEFAAPLVDVLMHTDRSDLAYELAQSILNIRLSCLSAHHPSLASAHDAFGRCLIISGNLERARRELSVLAVSVLIAKISMPLIMLRLFIVLPCSLTKRVKPRRQI